MNNNVYIVSDFGAVGDGITDNTEAFGRAIRAASVTRGTVLVPGGTYVCATVFLLDGVTLHISEDAVLLGNTDHGMYPMIEGVEGFTRQCHFGIIAALGVRDISVVGGGRIDARGECWWKSVPDDYVRPRTLTFIHCENVLIEDIQITNSPCWTVHPICCDGVTVRGVSIVNPQDSPNTDGINPESCSGVLIENCHIDVGDDCVTLKSGTETDLLLRSRPCKNITVRGCTMKHGHGGVVIGSEMSGGVSDVTIRDCSFIGTERGIRIKTRRYRGGYVRNINVENVVMENVGAAITLNGYYRCGTYTQPREVLFDPAPRPINDMTPVVEQINIRGIRARGTLGVGIYMYGLPEMPISDVSISDTELEVVGSADGFPAVTAYERELSRGEGVFLENVQNVRFNDLVLRCVGDETVLRNTKNVTVNGDLIA
jgi:polygalacturonase